MLDEAEDRALEVADEESEFDGGGIENDVSDEAEVVGAVVPGRDVLHISHRVRRIGLSYVQLPHDQTPPLLDEEDAADREDANDGEA